MAEEIEGKYIRDLIEFQEPAADDDILLIEDMSTIADVDTKRITKKLLLDGLALQSTLDEEVKRADAAEKLVQKNLDEEASRATTAEGGLSDRVTTIENKIPTQASAENQLADKEFVNSSIATATAEFKGTFTDLEELKKTEANANDYAFYVHTDETGNSIYDRYKYSTEWAFEYTVNTSSFTAAQWAAINSGITNTSLNNIETTLLKKQDNLESGKNIKTVNGESVLGEGNIDINAAIWGNITGEIEDQTDVVDYVNEKITNFVEVSEEPTVGKVWFNSDTELSDDYVYTKGEVDELVDKSGKVKDVQVDGGTILSDEGIANIICVPRQASISDSGLITFANGSGDTVFTLQLPLYEGD